MSRQNWLTALPVFNEAKYVNEVLNQVSRYSPQILVVDDGSSDETPTLLEARIRQDPDRIRMVRHDQNAGYGAALQTAFQFAAEKGYDYLVTIDCDGQHEPQRIPEFAAACHDCDIVSGSRYLQSFEGDSRPPSDRRWVNQVITAELNKQYKLNLSDAFCGFKAYRVESLTRFRLTENGYAMPLELWVQAAALGLRIVERPVPLIYLDEERTFGGALDDCHTRLEYYRLVLDRSRIRSGLQEGSAVLCGDENACP